MKRSFNLLLLPFIVLLVSCVHQFPEEDFSRIPFSLNLHFDTDMPIYTEIIHTKSVQEMADVRQMHDVRYVVNAYKVGSTREISRVPNESFVFTKPYIGNLDNTVEINLPEGEYEFKIWADYVDTGSQDDKYYDTSDFSEIILSDRNNHPGSNDYREAFRGYANGTILNPERYPSSVHDKIDHEAEVTMQRPMGKFIFISTDVDAFLTKVMKAMLEQTKGDNATIDITTKAGRDQLLQSIEFHKYKVRFRYNIFMPCSFNIFTDKPADSWTGRSFYSDMELISETEIAMGFDYAFVNGSTTTLSISLEVYNEENEQISSTNPINVPIVRNKLTVVKGEFLTTKATGGVAINPGWDGDDYNIEIY